MCYFVLLCCCCFEEFSKLSFREKSNHSRLNKLCSWRSLQRLTRNRELTEFSARHFYGLKPILSSKLITLSCLFFLYIGMHTEKVSEKKAQPHWGEAVKLQKLKIQHCRQLWTPSAAIAGVGVALLLQLAYIVLISLKSIFCILPFQNPIRIVHLLFSSKNI